MDLHYTRSHLTWNKFISQELEELEGMSREGLEGMSREGREGMSREGREGMSREGREGLSKELEGRKVESSKIHHIRSLYLARLAVLHAKLQDTFDDYSSFESRFDPDGYTNRMIHASKIKSATAIECSKRDPYEQALIDNPTCISYFAYIAFEKSQKTKDNLRIKSLFERALEAESLNPSVWIAYLLFLLQDLPIKHILQNVAEKAIQTISFSPDIWIIYIRIQKLYGSSQEHTKNAMLMALESLKNDEPSIDYLLVGTLDLEIELFCPYSKDYTSEQKAKILEFTQNALAAKASVFKHGDCCVLKLHVAFIQSRLLKDENAAVKTYENILKRFNTSTEIWLEYAKSILNLENIPKTRSILKDASRKNLDNFFAFYDYWLKFESTFGNAAQYYAAKSATIIYHAQNPYFYELQTVESTQPAAEKRKHSSPENSPKSKVPKKEHKDNEIQIASHALEYKVINNTNAGNMIYLEDLPSNITENMIIDTFASFGRITDLILQANAESGKLEAYVEFLEPLAVKKISLLDREVLMGTIPGKIHRCKPSEKLWNFQLDEQKKVLYVSNLPSSIDKRKIRELFSKFGVINEIRLTIRPTNVFAYVEFENEESAAKGLSLDQKEIQKGQIISVAISNPSKKATVADPKNLYVTNLPFSLIEQDVRDMFAPYGDIKMIRLLTDPKSGSFKGTAFVDFLQEEAASTALHALNGSMIQGRAVVVSVADPNRKSQKIQQVLEVRNRKASQFKPIILSKQLSAHPKQKKLAISNTPKNSTESDKIEQPPKTQQDFRNLFNIK